MARYITGDERADELRNSGALYCTPIPADSVPLRHLRGPRDLKRFLREEDIRKWSSGPPGTYLIIEPYAQPRLVTLADIQQYAKHLRDLLIEIIEEKDFVLVMLYPAPAHVKHDRPGAWLVRNMSTDASRVLRTGGGGAWSTTRGSFFAHTTLAATPTYIMTHEGLTDDPNNPLDEEELASILRGERFRQVTRALFEKLDPEMSEPDLDDRVTAALEKIRVEILDFGPKPPSNKSKIVVNVYCDPPTTNTREWEMWRTNMAKLQLRTPTNGVGNTRRQTRCTGCYGADHPAHLCPFRAIPNWCYKGLLPGEESFPAQNNADTDGAGPSNTAQAPPPGEYARGNHGDPRTGYEAAHLNRGDARLSRDDVRPSHDGARTNHDDARRNNDGPEHHRALPPHQQHPPQRDAQLRPPQWQLAGMQMNYGATQPKAAHRLIHR